MHVQSWLPLTVVRAIVRHIVVVMMATKLIMVAMTILVMLMDVKQNTGERSGRRRAGHADDGREGKRERHHPNEGEAASASLLQSRQHGFRLVHLRDRLS